MIFRVNLPFAGNAVDDPAHYGAVPCLSLRHGKSGRLFQDDSHEFAPVTSLLIRMRTWKDFGDLAAAWPKAQLNTVPEDHQRHRAILRRLTNCVLLRVRQLILLDGIDFAEKHEARFGIVDRLEDLVHTLLPKRGLHLS